MPRKSIDNIRAYTTRTKPQQWLPSIAGQQEFENTFTLAGVNADGTPSKGEINVFTNFDSKENSEILEPNNLNRFYLALYCLQNNPYFYEEINKTLDYKTDGKLFTQQLETFLEKYQTGQGANPQTRSLTADIVRYYRGDKVKDIADTEQEIQALINLSQTSKDYRKNVVGVLGKVTYDSIVKHTLYSLLVRNNVLKSQYEKGAKIWSEEASKLESGQYGFFVDVGGGTYSRAFPVLCVFTKNKSGKKINDLLNDSNNFVASKFFRQPNGQEQLVQSIGGKIKDKNFIELPVRQSGDSVYCFLYDFVNVLVLNTVGGNDFTLDLLKICLSFFSRKRLEFSTISEFKTFYESLQKYISSSFSDDIENLDFVISLKEKHALESSYFLAQEKDNIKSKLQNTFKAEITLLASSIGTVYSKIVDTFNQETTSENKNFQFNNYPKDLEYPIILHFDNFYNLLAATSTNISPQTIKKEYEQNIPFRVEDYDYEYQAGDLISSFFSDPKSLTKIPNSNTPDYQYTPSIATEQDIVLITDAFLRQTYENLKNSNLIYENDANQLVDNVLKTKQVNILKDISEKTGKQINLEDYFIVSSNKIYLKKDIIRKLDLNELYFIFESVKVDKIKFQTLNHLLFLNLEELKKRQLTIDDFKTRIYYPLLDVSISATKKEEEKDGPPKKTEVPKKPNEQNFLINNIITSELQCYGDIADSFDKAINAEKTEDKVYYAFQALVNIGLPILLALSAQALANKIAEQKKKGTGLDPSLLDCVFSDPDKLKKSIIGYADLASNLDSPEELLAFLTQGYLELPAIPAIPFFFTFDAEKELKRRIIKYVIDYILKLLGDQLRASIRSIIDMCNSDSYLTAFLNSALPSENNLETKVGTSTASGLPAGTSSTLYTPTLNANINILIDQTGIETRENVYELFRKKYNKQTSSNEISDFFDYLSNSIDAAEMASLLRASSTLETRSTVVSYISNYTNKDFYMFIGDEVAVSDLFNFLSDYIDFRLCYGIFNNSLSNYSSNVCEDLNSRYDDNILTFGEEAINDEIADLTKSLDEICRSKFPTAFDLLSSGPSFLTKKMSSVLENGFNSTTSNVFDAQKRILDSAFIKTEKPEPYSIPVDVKLIFSIEPNDQLSFEDIKEQFYQYTGYEDDFKNKLKNSGNVGLKTSPVSIDGYVRKLQAFTDILISLNNDDTIAIENKTYFYNNKDKTISISGEK